MCPLNVKKDCYKHLACFAMRLKDTEDIYNSASGGAFYALAKMYIDRGGVVFGAAYDAFFSVKHVAADSVEGLENLRKSKYIQSDIGNTYERAKELLEKDIPVLFSGTPCQIAGLTAFLGKDYRNLLKLQLFCHAIPSPGVWRKYIEQKEKEYNSNLCAVDFRHKIRPYNTNAASDMGVAKSGWKNPVFRMTFENGEEYSLPFERDPFVSAFAQELVNRNSCYSCRFKLDDTFSGADLSIGDFWGADAFIPEFCVDGGISAIIVHTQKGMEALDEIDRFADLLKVDLDIVRAQNKVVFIPEPPHRNRDKFFRDFAANTASPEELIRKHLGFFAANSHLALRFGLFGSYNSREIINTAVKASNCALEFQFSNSSISSAMSKKITTPPDVTMPSNSFRAQMMKGDWEKSFVNYDFHKIDYLCIDLLEERFPISKYNNSYITLSDALNNSDFLAKRPLKPLPRKEAIDLFKIRFEKFVNLLVKCQLVDKTILLETYLCEKYGTRQHCKYFENSGEIGEINRMLRELYDYITVQCDMIHVVSIKDANLLYCDQFHKHGCHPWNMNKYAYEQFATELCNITINLEERK
jgi:coenzyme F420-reducing hydrogenase beta subunit